jgi:hypothetical protein
VKRRKVLFLDIDGVCNSHCFFQVRHLNRIRMGDDLECPYSWRLDPEAVARVDGVCSRARAQVVVISSWRNVLPMPTLRGVLRRAGLRAAVIDRTPKLGDPNKLPRGPEVVAWLAANMRDLESYVILDDTDDMGPTLRHRHVLTSTDSGMSRWDAKVALYTLRKPIAPREMDAIAATVARNPRARRYVTRQAKVRKAGSR